MVPTVLLVDDEEMVGRAVKRLLAPTGWRILLAQSGEEALALLERERVQVVLSDHRMPGMSGVDLLVQVKSRHPAVERILFTGQADRADIQAAINGAEIRRLIPKPWDDEQLVLGLSSAIEQQRLGEENRRLQELLAERNGELERLARGLDRQVGDQAARLRSAASEWRACMDAIAEPLAVLHRGDKGCQVRRGNRAFAEEAGVGVEALPNLVCADSTFGKLPCPLCHGAEADGEANREREIPWKDRLWRIRSYRSAPIGTVVIFKDVTLERAREHQLQQTEKMTSLGQLAGGVAHEINNPLGGIMAFAQLMLAEPRSDEDRSHLKTMLDAGVRAKRVVDMLLVYSRSSSEGPPGPVDLNRVLDDALLLLQPRLNRGGDIEIVRDGEAAMAQGSSGDLGLVASNLISNAIDAMGGRGRLTLTTGHNGDRPFFSVGDSGEGVDAELAARIFEPFFSTKKDGKATGLGLSLCQRIVENHGGSIRLHSVPGRGAKFTVELPPRKA
jgi:two-component system NtrC family sensor kinase